MARPPKRNARRTVSPHWRWVLPWTLLLLIYLAGTPAISRWLVTPLEAAPALQANNLPAADAIVVLGAGIYHHAPEYGGDTVSPAGLERLRYAALLYRTTHLPIALSGGHPEGGTAEGVVMAQVLQDDFHVPVRWIEARSRNTRENAIDTRQLLPPGTHTILLVTHAWHMPRAAWSFRHAGFQVIPAPTGYTNTRPARWSDWLPQPAGWNNTAIVLHEWLGQIWYHLIQ